MCNVLEESLIGGTCEGIFLVELSRFLLLVVGVRVGFARGGESSAVNTIGAREEFG